MDVGEDVATMAPQIWKVRELLFTLVRRDLLVRYQSSVLGFLWSFAKPLALVAIFGVAFRLILKVPMPSPAVPFSLHLLVGVLAWSFLARCIGEGHWAVLSHANLIKKVKLPLEVFPATTVIGNLINFFLAMLVVFPCIFFLQSRGGGVDWIGMPVQMFLFLGVTALMTALAYAITLAVSALHVFYRDVESLTEVVLQAWFYATPIVYPVSLLRSGKALDFCGERWAPWLERLYWLNPMTPICVAYRRILLYRAPLLEAPGDAMLLSYLGCACLTTGLLYLAGAAIFRFCSHHFADEV